MYKNAFPKEMLVLKNWTCWRYEPDPNGGKDKKVPYCPKTGKRAKVDNPSTWGTYEEAIEAVKKYVYNGIGFVFSEEVGIVAIDIDDCFKEDGELNELAKTILAKAPKTFIERSPSKKGLHILVYGKIPGGGKRNKAFGLEIYATSRYFTMTGDLWHDCADTIANDNGIVDYAYKLATMRKKNTETTETPPTVLSILMDDELIKLANASKDGADFTKLYRGEWQGAFKSQSEADFALCRKLAFWSGKNEGQIDRIFRTSGLMRDKWNENHHAGGITYGAKTITNACTATKQVYKPPRLAKSLYTAKASKDPPDPDAPAEGAPQGEGEREPEIVEYLGCYFRNKSDKFYQVTNFTVEPIQMLEYEDGAQISANFITYKGEKYLIHLEAPSMIDVRTFKAALAKKTFALTFLGGNGDLDQFKMFLYDMPWVKKRGVKSMGIYPRNKGQDIVFVTNKGAMGVGNVPNHTIVQLESFKEIQSDILSAPLIDKAGLMVVAEHILTYNEPAKAVPILAWTAGCFIKPHLKKHKIKFPHLFLVGERGGGKSNSMERVIMPLLGHLKKQAASQITHFSI